MSGGFRDSFTKEDTKEDLLGYDDTAFYYFAITVLTCVAVPWTLSVVYNLLCPGKAQVDKDYPSKSTAGSAFRYCQTAGMVEKVESARREARKCTRGLIAWWVVKAVLLATIWAGIYGTVVQLGDEKEINKFDPFELLEVTPNASPKQIKKKYLSLSVMVHPDKNPDDPLAASRFIQITKAYQALTDEVARRNWEKYGNPDGPQSTKVGIGLPKFLLVKENNLMNLCAFFFVLLFVIPMAFICYFQRTKNFVGNGVMVETLQFLGYYVTETARVKNCPELLAACSESRLMGTRPSDSANVALLKADVVEHKKLIFTLPIIKKNQCLIWGHMQRKHHLMTPELRSDCDELLRHSLKITQAMIEIACMREWFTTAQAMIDFRRCLVQALDVKSSQLLQIPHVTDQILKPLQSPKTTMPTLAEFLKMSAEERKVLTASMDPQQLADVDAFCAHVSDVDMQASICVEDEKEIVVGDVATVTARLVRQNIQSSEAMGPVHAPLFPEPKFEEWWLFLVESTPPRIVNFERACDAEASVEKKLRFQVTRSGKNTIVLHGLCDSFIGIDKKVELTYHALTEEEANRKYPIHEDDEELDMQPTLFQQWMGDFSHEEESEEEEGETSGGGGSGGGGSRWRSRRGDAKAGARGAAGRADRGGAAGARGDADSGGSPSAAGSPVRASGRDAAEDGQKARAADEESSVSSSESDED